MAKKHQIKTTAVKSQKEAEAIAGGIQRPGQRKEQTKLIAQGIQKGIEMYKAEQRAKLRDADKKRKQALKQKESNTAVSEESRPATSRYQCFLPWFLLLLSWAIFGFYLSQF